MLFLLRFFRSAIGLVTAVILVASDKSADAAETVKPSDTIIDGHDIEARVAAVRLRFINQKNGGLPDADAPLENEKIIAQWYNWPNWNNFWNDWGNWPNFQWYNF